MRRIEHPGPADPTRVEALDVVLEPFSCTLAPGRPLLDTLAQALTPHAAEGATLTLRGGALFPFVHVLPALSSDPAHAVYYSGRHEAANPVDIEFATVTVGRCQGDWWLHAHARWRDPDGTVRCGHVLPDESIVSAPIQVQGCLLRGAGFVVTEDRETNFSLFRPVASGAGGTATVNGDVGDRGLLVRLAPNVDVCTALASICAERDFDRAVVVGGVGSTVGARFDDDRVVEPFVTELLVEHGEIAREDDGRYRVDIDVSLVDYTGGVARGRLAAGANPVLVTFELALLLAA